MKKYLTHMEVCELLSVSRRTLFRWRQDGYFPQPSYIGRRPVYGRDVVDAWITQQTSQ